MLDKSHRIDCVCDHHLHFVKIYQYEDDELEFCVVGTADTNFWRRLKKAFDYLFFRKEIVETDIIFKVDDLKELIVNVESSKKEG